MIRNALLAAALAIPTLCVGQVVVIPSTPKEQETVRVRVAQGVIRDVPFVVAGFNTYEPRATRVSMSGNRITVSVELFNNGFPITSRELDLPVGQLPAGDYQAEVVRRLPDGTAAGLLGTVAFTVAPRGSNNPLLVHTDLWWNPQESGSGMNIMQHGSGVIFATWFVYGTDGRPTWYVVPEGQWATPEQYQGPIYRTTGPPFDGPFNPSLVTATLVGSATFGFDLFNSNSLGVSLTIDGRTTTKQLQRQSF